MQFKVLLNIQTQKLYLASASQTLSHDGVGVNIRIHREGGVRRRKKSK